MPRSGRSNHSRSASGTTNARGGSGNEDIEATDTLSKYNNNQGQDEDSEIKFEDEDDSGTDNPLQLQQSLSSSSSANQNRSRPAAAVAHVSIYDPVPIFPTGHGPAGVSGGGGGGLLLPTTVNSVGDHHYTFSQQSAAAPASLPSTSNQSTVAEFKQPIQLASSTTSFRRKEVGSAKRRKVSQACVYCRRSHMTCDEGRPCQRCIKRKIAHLCHDEAKLPTSNNDDSSQASTPTTSLFNTPIPPPANMSAAADMVAAAAASLAAGNELSPAVVAAVASALPSVTAMTSSETATPFIAGQNSKQSSSSSSSYQLPTISAFQPMFASEHMGNEFNVLTDFLASLDEYAMAANTPAMAATNDAPSTLPTPTPISAAALSTAISSAKSASTPTGLGLSNLPDAPTNTSTPTSAAPLSSTEKYILTAADPADGSFDDRLNQVITAKYEAGLLRPYNYINSYTRLQRWMESHMSPSSRQRILNVMGVFRPRFRYVAQSLTDMDLVMVEEAFERLLLEYDRVFSSMGIPSCLWRRTGEIWKCNKEFARLVNMPMEKLRDGKVSIYELMTEESAVSYWEKYGNIAFDASQKAVLTSCMLKGLGADTNVLNCCFSFTIRRDKYNIPLMVAGNFLPATDEPASARP